MSSNLPNVFEDLRKDFSEKLEKLDEDFISSTTLHGVHHFLKDKSFTHKAVWGLLFVLSITICIWQITDRVKNYLAYPTNGVTNVHHINKLPFPAITICSCYRYNNKTVSDEDRKVIERTDGMEDFDYYDMNETINTNFTEIIKRTGYQIDNSTLKYCVFGGYECYPEDFILSFNHKYNLCWTFNGNHFNQRNQLNPGSDYGFKLNIDLKEEEYVIPRPSPRLGLKLFIHPPYETPHIYGSGLMLGPGLQTSTIIHYEKNINLKKPYGNCTDDDAVGPSKYYKKYSLPNCLDEIQTNNIIDSCECHPLFYPEKDDEFVCSFIDMRCVEDTLKKEDINENNKSCEVSCVEEAYDVTISYVAVIDNNNLKSTLKRIGANSSEYVRNNFVFLNAYYENFIYVETRTEIAVTASSLISDIGGQLGLFMGMSLLTLVEVCEYFSKRLIGKFFLCSKSKKIPPIEIAMEEGTKAS